MNAEEQMKAAQKFRIEKTQKRGVLMGDKRSFCQTKISEFWRYKIPY
jgi:hypothetical protein